AIMAEIASLTPSYGGITYDRLSEGGIQWPCPSVDHPGTPYLHKGQFVRGKGKFHVTPYVPAPELPDEEYPLFLTTGRILYHYHGVLSRKSKPLSEMAPEPIIDVSREDARKIGFNGEGARVVVESRRGSIEARARAVDYLQEGLVFMTFHFKEAAANLLTLDSLDPVSKIPGYKVCAVRIRKATEEK
ncbi:MAG: molybdopterin dinucleotide binding domain-containing protein, partial [Syntrophorhabdales bacterium]